MRVGSESVEALGPANPPELRSILFLQGPISDFFDRLGRALIGRGHRVHRINLHLGDRLFWHLPAVNFRARFDGWRGFVGAYLDRHAITHLVVHGDRRPHHIVAAEEARARGIPVISTDLGYVRPDWITVEYDGMASYSRFPRDPDAIRELARHFPPLDLTRRFRPVSFTWTAVLDVLYNVAQVLGRPLYPHYRWHGIYHPYAEYAGWILTLGRHRLTHSATIAAKVRLQNAPKSYFLFPLQLATDYQIRAHSPFADVRDAVRDVIASFARSGSDRKLVLIVHPLDNGLIGWGRLARRFAREYGVAERVLVVRDGTPLEVLRRASGIVTINSTVGLTALIEGVPVKLLGNAVFDVPGLTFQDSLDRFWLDPTPPDPSVMEAFLRALVGATQVRGGYYERESKEHAIAGFVERLERGLFPLPPLGAAELAERKIRPCVSAVALLGAATPVGSALARDYAAPGVALFLVGAPEQLEGVPEDCRRRGAEVVTCRQGDDLCRALEDFDRDTPIELLIAAGAAEPVGAAARAMARRGRGRVVLVSGLGRRHPPVSREAMAALRTEAELLRQELGDAVAVSIVRPSRLAAWLASRGDQRVLELGAERAARLIRRGCERYDGEIAMPGRLAATGTAIRFLPGLLRGWAKDRVLPVTPAAGPKGEEAPLSSETMGGN